MMARVLVRIRGEAKRTTSGYTYQRGVTFGTLSACPPGRIRDPGPGRSVQNWHNTITIKGVVVERSSDVSSRWGAWHDHPEEGGGEGTRKSSQKGKQRPSYDVKLIEYRATTTKKDGGVEAGEGEGGGTNCRRRGE